jgi:hypothetical protein
MSQWFNSRRRKKARCSVDLVLWEELRWQLVPAKFGALVNALIWMHIWDNPETVSRRLLRSAGVGPAAIKTFLELELLEAAGEDEYAWKCSLLRFDTKPPKRKPMSPRTRWHILERDGFRCRYCGRSASEVKLHVDHMIPVSAGGTDDHDNLVTACAECNLGKKDLMPTFEIAA